MTSQKLQVCECIALPGRIDLKTVYRLLPNDPDKAYYRERVDRNIGWIREDEQELLKNSVVGIAGCGGMGGQLAQIFLRLGVGEIRIADCEFFDASNINRQFAAGRKTVGVSKALATARMLRDITDDTTLVVYPQGIVEETVEDFVRGCDVICDEIEFWAIGARILLHQTAREHNVPLFVCSTVGFGTRLMFFKPDGYTMESCVNLTLEEAFSLQRKVQTRSASDEEMLYALGKLVGKLVPEVHGYTSTGSEYDDLAYSIERARKTGEASIISTNPSMASGFLADRVLLYLLKDSGITRDTTELPEPPGYLYVDAAKMLAKTVLGER